MPRCSPHAELEAVLGPDLEVALIPLPPNQEVLWQPGAAAHAQLHAALSEDAKTKKKQAFPGPGMLRRTSGLRREG